MACSLPSPRGLREPVHAAADVHIYDRRVVGEREAIRIEGTRAEAVLLMHGLTGVPNELHVLGDRIARDGYTVLIPLLPGRGTVARDMDRLSWEDWMIAAVGAYDDLANTHERIVIGGLSAGATMALDLALRRRAEALLLYAPALGIANRLAYLTPYAWRLVRRWRSPAGGTPGTPGPAVSTYDPVPLRAVAELVRGMRRIRPRLDRITAPALIIHSAADRYVPVANARALARRLGGPVELVILEGPGHAITADAEREAVSDRTRAFLRRIIEQRDHESGRG